jgi:geranyl-CoA carboxylase alpha subunit
MAPFKSILVANRGEIAVRVMRTARDLGYRTIAVYSEADAEALHVQVADEAVCIGPAAATQSYLVIDNIIKAAKESGAEAIHPGYGFLSENADFGSACEAAGIVLIGPPPSAIHQMGNKAQAKRLMIAANVPCVPGYQGEEQDDETLIRVAGGIGLPLMVKAAAGGGGRGMSLVHDLADLPRALTSSRSVARNSFGSDELILEKAIVGPRHVEVQVFADNHGNVIHLGERDCSVQRRHQKVVEEAPCPIMTPELREAMGVAAVEAARAIEYRGAGTVEFLLDSEGKFYFLEMNTRLQVEHPVTELITGLDLVALQIKVAQGEPLGITQDDVTLTGHAMEVRLYAEDPSKGFLPKTGRVDLWQPATGAGVRVDAGIASGQEITPFYDPMLAKVIAWGPDRDTARTRLIKALKETLLFGSITNRAFLIDVLARDAFARGEATTAFLEEHFTNADLKVPAVDFGTASMAAVLQYCLERDVARGASVDVPDELLNWSSAGALQSRYAYKHGKVSHELLVSPLCENRYRVRSTDEEMSVEVQALDGQNATLRAGGRSQVLYFLHQGEGVLQLSIDGRNREFRNLLAFAAEREEVAGNGQVLAPMHGTVQSVFVSVGEQVKKGQRLAVVEAMKMQHDILADIDGAVEKVLADVGAQVAANDLLVAINVSVSTGSRA